MKIEEIHKMWAEDSMINSADLTESSLQSPILHAKYLRIFSTEKSRLVLFEMEQKKLLKKKWLYYNGKMDGDEIEAEGWEFDPFNGLKVLKGEMNYYYDADDDIQKSEMKIKLQKEKIDTLKEIIENIKWRHQNIRNIITWKQFEAGG
jgi:thymidylate synthase